MFVEIVGDDEGGAGIKVVFVVVMLRSNLPLTILYAGLKSGVATCA